LVSSAAKTVLAAKARVRTATANFVFIGEISSVFARMAA
jgi:hypothetical protein